jgi:transcriptional regulator with XRE-family HTH domain
MKEFVKNLASEFEDKEYADSYLEEFTNMEIATQIKVLREQRDLTQKQLSVLSGINQERVSKLENVDYDSWTIKTLHKFAKAFDVGLKVSFEPISSRILDIDRFSRKDLERDSRIDSLHRLKRELDLFYAESNSPKVVVTSSGPSSIHQHFAANDDWHSLPESHAYTS